MNPCDDRLPAIVDVAEGASDAALDAHVATCAGCRDALATLKADARLVRATRASADDFSLAGLAARTTDRAEAYRDRSLAGLWWGLNRANRWSLGVSTAALAASLAFFVAAPGRPVEPAAAMPDTSGAVATAEAPDDDVLDEAHDDMTPSLDDAFSMLTDDEVVALSEKLDDSGS